MSKSLKPFSTIQKKHISIVGKTLTGKIEKLDGKATFKLDDQSVENGVTLQDDENGLGTTIIPDKNKPAPGHYKVTIDADADLSEAVAMLENIAEGDIIEPAAQVIEIAEDDAVDQ